MNTEQMIAIVEKSIADKSEAVNQIMAEALGAGETPNEEQEAKIKSLEAETAVLETNLERLKKIQAGAAKAAQTAKPVAPAVIDSASLRDNGQEKGIGFAQIARVKMLMQHSARKDSVMLSPLQAAKALGYNDRVAQTVEKAVLGTTTDTGFAAPLVEPKVYAQEFIELLRNANVFAQIAGYRNVPFNVKINAQLTGGSSQWVGEGKAKPLTNPTYGHVDIKEHKLAAITVYTDELLRRADPAIDKLVLDDLIKSTADLINKTFLDDAAQTDARPAGILNGATKIDSTGTTADKVEADLLSLINTFATANLSTDNSYLLMSETRAMQLALLRDALGNAYFHGMSFAGTRSLLGLPVVTSQAVGDKIVLLKASELFVAQDGDVDVSYSDQATLTDGSTVHNLWQENKAAVRVEKYITWAKRRPIAAAYIQY